MNPLRFVIQLASKDVRARLRVNRVVVAAASGERPAAIAKHIGTYLVRGRNVLELQATLLPETGEGPRVLELALHAAGPNAPLSEATLMLAYSMTENEVPPGEGPHTLVSHALGLGSDAEARHAWEDGREIAQDDALSFASEGLERCRKALDARDAAGLAQLVALHAQDHAALLGVPVEQASDDLIADVVATLGTPDARVEIASVTELAPELVFSGRAVHVSRKGGAAPITVATPKASLAIYPTFAAIDGKATIVRWS